MTEPISRDDPLPEGVYEALVGAGLHPLLDDRAVLRDLGPTEAPRRLGGHFGRLLTRCLETIRGDDRVDRQVALVNELVAVLARHKAARPELDDLEPRLLTAVTHPGAAPRPAPQLPLSESGLYVNANRERSLDQALALELESADRVDLICAFLFWTGYVRVRDVIERHLAAGRPLRVLTTTYCGVTQARVLDELCRLGADVQVSYETGATRLHAKAWLFHRDSGFSTAFVGSSNLSHSALTSGLEWNVRLSEIENRAVVHELCATFDNLWSETDFLPYAPEDFARRTRAERPTKELKAVFELRPRTFQQAVLDRLDTERSVHGHHRNLVVSATGTGKTVIAALDYARLCRAAGRPLNLLFVAHRREILERSRETFCHAMSDGSFGEEFVAGRRPTTWRHVFASVQSFQHVDLTDWPSDHFDVVIVDEFHHAAAATYARLLDHFCPQEPPMGRRRSTPPPHEQHPTPPSSQQPSTAPSGQDDPTPPSGRRRSTPPSGQDDPTPPSGRRRSTPPSDQLDHTPLTGRRRSTPPTTRPPTELLGLTATPERADGQSILARFDGRIASELRLWDAIDRGLLCPFQYFGVHDTTDLRHAWRRGRFDPRALEGIYTGHHRWAHLVVEALRAHVHDPTTMRALAFCAGTDHARFVAQAFTQAGIPTAEILGTTPERLRTERLAALREGTLACLVTVDVFNEGVDIPALDTLLFLRPTESATVFLQQLGRGLRHHPGKGCTTVLDFIGQAPEAFRHVDRYRALFGRMGRTEVQRQVEQGFPYLPSGCSLQLDPKSQELILQNIAKSLRLDRRALAKELAQSGQTILAGFVGAAGLDLEELYRGGRTFTELKRLAHLPCPPPGPSPAPIARNLGRLLHVDDPLRLDAWRAWLAGRPIDPTLELMLLCALLDRTAATDLPAARATLRAHPALCAELTELLTHLADRRETTPLPWLHPARIPLQLHATYSLREIMAAFTTVRDTGLHLPREGVHFDPRTRCNLLFVTLEKDEADYSPTTLYRDYALSADRFHWQSQAGTRPTDTKGRRHLHHTTERITPLLFVRPRKKDPRNETLPYQFLGPLHLESHTGERPIDIVWRLTHPMPARTLQLARVAR